MRRCLIIEDDPLFVEILTRTVKPFDLEVEIAADVASATAALGARDYDVIFLDLHLGSARAGGAGIAAWIRRVKPHLLPRVLAVTGSPGATRHLGPDVPVMDKGNVETLAARIRDLLV